MKVLHGLSALAACCSLDYFAGAMVHIAIPLVLEAGGRIRLLQKS